LKENANDVFISSGVLIFQGCDENLYNFQATRIGTCYRILLKLKIDQSATFEDVCHRTCVRLSKFPNKLNNPLRSSEKVPDITVLEIEQFHVIKKFQGKKCGSKLIALIFIWAKFLFPSIQNCVVISPSSKGIPFYHALGAKKMITSSNLEFNL
jgi:hypothetical protein